MLKCLLFLMSIHLTLAGNILFLSSTSGSHFFFMTEIANVLSAEHNVTFVNLVPDDRVGLDPRITVLIPEGFTQTVEEYNTDVREFIGNTELKDSTQMHTDIFNSNAAFERTFKFRWAYLESDEYFNLVKNGRFDAIVIEDANFIDTSMPIKQFNIPFVTFLPVVDHFNPRRRQNFPYLYNSEPSYLMPYPVQTAPSFKQRVLSIVDIGKFLYFMSAYITFLGEKVSKYGLKTTEDLNHQVHLSLHNDHPALSFPHLDPPNAINIGCFYCRPAQLLPDDITSFLDLSERDVIYVSFGSYTALENVPWFPEVLRVLEDLDIRIILKGAEGDKKGMALSDKFLVKSWVPQKDLLGSGKVKIFISHCGNNGRLESVFYKVPILCVPLFGDQYLNAKLIQRRDFGRIVLKEDMFGERGGLADTLSEMLEHHLFYKKNTEIASDILQSQPASGSEKILYYFNLLVKNGNLDFLKNEVVLEQNMVEMHNLDILFVIMTMILGIALLVLFILVKCCCAFKRKLQNGIGKLKSE